jgi:ethanolamine utilization protein EutQ (cupin superfamily)
MGTLINATRWDKFCELMDEGKISVILEGESSSIDGGVIVTDSGDVLDFMEKH